MGQNNNIAGPTVFVFFACIVVCMTEGPGVHFQVEFEEVQQLLILTCKIDSGTLPVNFYNHGELLARCWITHPINCTSLLGNRSTISFDSKTKKSTLKIRGLKNEIGNWRCSHGGKKDASSSVLIKGPVEPNKGSVAPSKGPVEPIACNEHAKTDETSLLVLIFFVVSFLIVWLVIIVIEERMKNNSSPGKFLRCNAKRLSGIKVCSTFTILICVIIVACVLDDTTANKIAGSCLAAILGCCLPVCLQLKPCESPEIEGCCLTTFLGCCLPMFPPSDPCASDGNVDNKTKNQAETAPCLTDSRNDDPI